MCLSKSGCWNESGQGWFGGKAKHASITATQQRAETLADWLATDPTGSGDSDYLIIGDLNAYAMEDPIVWLEAASYTDLVEQYVETDAYSYVFLGQAGYLDHALASSSMAGQVTDASIWHINADEPSVLDYNTEYKSAGQVISLYAADEYRASDHDPLIVDLELGFGRIYLPVVTRVYPQP